MVIAGKHKGKVSKVERVDGDKLFLKWVNEVKKAVKGKGFVKKILPIHISNCMYYNEAEKKASRVGIKIDEKGKRKRFLKRFKKVLID